MENILLIVVCHAESHDIGCCTINKEERAGPTLGDFVDNCVKTRSYDSVKSPNLWVKRCPMIPTLRETKINSVRRPNFVCVHVFFKRIIQSGNLLFLVVL